MSSKVITGSLMKYFSLGLSFSNANAVLDHASTMLVCNVNVPESPDSEAGGRGRRICSSLLAKGSGLLPETPPLLACSCNSGTQGRGLPLCSLDSRGMRNNMDSRGGWGGAGRSGSCLCVLLAV